jgi:hypothetical protein
MPMHSGLSRQNFASGAFPLPRHRALIFLTARSANGAINFLYDPPTLRNSLELAGFKQITQYGVNEITDRVFYEAEIRNRYHVQDIRVINAWEAMAFEAVR